MVGPAVSMLMPPTMNEAAFPALSVADLVTDWLAPSPVSVTGDGHDAMPESASEHVKVIVTGPLYQPLAFGLVVTAPVMVGFVRSMLIPPTEAVSLLPAMSFALPVTDWPAPSPPSVTGASQLATPENASEHVKLTVTDVLF